MEFIMNTTEIALLPHSREIEQAVLGAMLTDPECIADVTPFLKDSSVFYLRRHRMIYDAICELYSAGSAVDILTVFEQLQNTGKPAEAGGISYLAECSAQVLSSGSVMQHSRILVEHHLRRQGAGVCRRALKAFESGNHTASDIVDRLNNDLLNITDRLTGSYKTSGWEELVAEIEWCMANRGKPVGISSGYQSLDRIIRGFEDGEYILLAGRPSMGKTNFMLNLARLLDKRDVPAGILSLESTTRKLRTRMLCQHGRYNVYDFTDARTGDEYFNGVLARVGELTSPHINMAEVPGISIMELRSRAVSLKRKHGIKILFIDHLGEIFVESESMYVKTTKVSTQLRAPAKKELHAINA